MQSQTSEDPAVTAMREIFRKYGDRLRTKLLADYRRPKQTMEYYWDATLAELKSLRVPAHSKPELISALKSAIREEWLGTGLFQDDETIREMVEEAAAVIQAQSHPRSGRPPDSLVTGYRETIQKLAKKGLIGEDYCRALGGLPVPWDWRNRYGCPETYLAAWNHPDLTKQKRFRKLISQQKSRHSHSLNK